MNPHPLLTAITAIGVTLFLHHQAAAAEAPPPTPEVESENSDSPRLRVWVMIPPEKYPPIVGDQPMLSEKLALIYDGDDGKPQYLVNNAAPYDCTGYIEIPPNPIRLRLMRQTPGAMVELASATVEPKSGSFHTAIIQKSGGYKLSLIDETPPPPPPAKEGEPPPPPPKQIVFYNFIPGTNPQISCKDPNFSRTVGYGQSQLATGLPGKIFSVTMPMKSKKREYLGQIEVDLAASDNLSFLIVQDFYGRTTAKILTNAKSE